MQRNTPIFLKEWRIKRELTQDQLAARLGVPTPYVSRWETGKVAWKPQHLPAFADALNVDVPDLFRDPDAADYEAWRIIRRMKPATQRRAVNVLKALDQSDDAA